ncbi:hypothetical protein [Micromonospora sp. WMMD1274]|uniref:hypothetical protein n=1 Tax=Micromonospora sp. WMMD1274 TaxID=3404116 RepID=UPI003B95A050
MTSSTKIKGIQTPRIGNFPEAQRWTAGEKAIRLAEKLGIKLEPWQKYILRNSLSEVADSDDLSQMIWAAHTVGLVVPRQNGKTFVLIVLILASLFLFHEKVLLTSQRLENAEAVLLEVAEYIKNSPASLGLKKKLARGWLRKKNGSHRITLTTGACLMVCARGNAARSKTIDRVIHDEAYDYTDEDEAALGYTTAARPNPQTWFVSTPPEQAGVDGPFSRLRQAGHAGEEGIAWFEWSIGTDTPVEDLDLTDKKLWAIANPAYGRIKDRVIQGELKRSSRAAFARERLGVWPIKAGNSLIPEESWKAIADPDSVPAEGVKVAIGACAWGTGSKVVAAVAIWSEREDGLGHLEIIRTDPGVSWVPGYLAELKDKYEPIAIGIDPKSPLNAVALELAPLGLTIPKNPDEPEFGDLAVLGGPDYVAANLQFVNAVTEKSFRHRTEQRLDLAVFGAATRKFGDVLVFDRGRSAVDTSPLTAGLIARWAYVTRKDSVGSGDYDLSDSFG